MYVFLGKEEEKEEQSSGELEDAVLSGGIAVTGGTVHVLYIWIHLYVHIKIKIKIQCAPPYVHICRESFVSLPTCVLRFVHRSTIHKKKQGEEEKKEVNKR